jgi:hypothetical protein
MRVAVVTAAGGIDEVAAKSNEQSILAAQPQLHGVDPIAHSDARSEKLAESEANYFLQQREKIDRVIDDQAAETESAFAPAGGCQTRSAAWMRCGAPCQPPSRMTSPALVPLYKECSARRIRHPRSKLASRRALYFFTCTSFIASRRIAVLRKWWRKAVLNRHRRWRSFGLQPAMMFDCPVC